jgi:hypothetical protein
LILGNIPPKTEAIIEIILFQTLDIDDMSYRLRIPTVYVPRYVLKGEIFTGLLEELENL